MKNEKVSGFNLKAMFVATMLLLILVFVLQVRNTNGNTFGTFLSNMAGARVETWAEQTWQDKWFGDGFWQTRTLYTIDPFVASTSTVYENRKLLLSTSNNTSTTQSASYSYTETKGHTVGAEIKAKSAHFEAALGYSFNYATSKGYTANVNVPAKKAVTAYGSDIRVREQYNTYKQQPQRANNIFATSWVNNGSASTSYPLVKQYTGYHIEWK